ncbi:MAG: acyltransferase [Gammaproteobacteria bacterium]|nr:MAG: acyltransferase [Gammaproteobacteria bacterium]
MKVAFVQQAVSPHRDENWARYEAGIAEAAALGARLVLLPELFLDPYPCQGEDPERFDLAEPIPGPATQRLGEIARKHGIIIATSLFERRARGLYHNTGVVLERDGQLAGRYRKMHIPDDPGYEEKFYFAPGDLGFAPIPTSLGRIGLLVCWDQWFPEAARLMALQGADILLYPTAIGWDPKDSEAVKRRQKEAWQIIQRGHAIANHLPLIACNRTGFEPPGIDFWGGSFIAGQEGEVLCEAPADAPFVGVAEIDFKRTEKLRRLWPFLRDRRIDAYGGLLRRFIDNEPCGTCRIG